MPLLKNLLEPLNKSALISLGLTTAKAVADPRIHNKIIGLRMTKLITSNQEMDDIVNIVNPYFKDSGLLITGVWEAMIHEVKNVGFLACC